MAIVVHHLNDSRSQRILWLLEELELPYEIVQHTRLPIGMAPPELKDIHPLGKAPAVDIDGYVIAESGAALELITQRFGGGKLMPDAASADYPRYLELLHYAEGSAATYLTMAMFGRLFQVQSDAYHAYVKTQVDLHMGHIAGLLEGRTFLVGDDLTAADVQLTFTLQMTRRSKLLDAYPGLLAYVARMEARPAYQRAIERGGPFTLDLRPAR